MVVLNLRSRKAVLLISVVFFVNFLIAANYYYSHGTLEAHLNKFKALATEKLDYHTNLFKAPGNNSYEKFTITYSPYNKPENLGAHNSVLLTTLVADWRSFGTNRTFEDLLQVMSSLDYDYEKLSLGVLFVDQAVYDHAKAKLVNLYENPDHRFKFFSKVSIVYAPFLGSSMDRNARHDDQFQKQRRTKIALSRNYLVNMILEHESAVLTIDADITKIHPNTLNYFVDSGKDILTPMIYRDKLPDYDRNTWQGPRIKPSDEERAKMVESQKLAVEDKDLGESFLFVPRDSSSMKHMHDFKKQFEKQGIEKLDQLHELDSVGGAVLFIKSEILKLGIQFPPFYVIGSDWDLPLGGYDGIETEGLCYVAKIMGYSCWGMPNLIAYHVA